MVPLPSCRIEAALQLVAPTAEDQGTFAVQVTVNIHGATPTTTFAVARAVDLNPDGVCTEATGWLPLGDLTTSPGGAGAAHFEVHRGTPFLVWRPLRRGLSGGRQRWDRAAQ
jgi:hypothetical protein